MGDSDDVDDRPLDADTELTEPADDSGPAAVDVAGADMPDPQPAPEPEPEAEPDLSAYPGLAVADGRRRRRTALAVLIAAVVAGGAGMWVGTLIQSPADRAAARSAPIPSLITVPVERRRLTSEVVLPGEVAYNEPVTLQLAGGVGISPGETAVITEVREAGTELSEGDVLVEVTSRPVFVLQGDLPMYRRLIVGTEGPDVRQLEEALVRLGYAVDPVDTVFDASTAAAVEQMYADAGYPAEGPSDEQRAELTGAREAVTAAQSGVTDARKALAEAQQPLPESERLQLEQTLRSAREGVPAAQTAAQTTRTEQDLMVNNARAARDTARTQRDAAANVRDAAYAPGAIDPDTGEPYSAERIAALEVAAAEAQQALVDAEGQLVVAEQGRTAAVTAADQAIADAQTQLQIVEAQYNESTAARDTEALQAAVGTAETQLADAEAALVTLEAQAGTRVSPGEVVFAPVLPSTLTETYVTLGSGIDGPIGMLTTTDTLVKARISRTDAGLVAVGSQVTIELRDAGIEATGTVLSVGEPASSGDQSGGMPGEGSGSSGRMEVVVQPSGGADLGMYMFWSARVRVPIDATDGEVLVVPVAALTVGPDEVSQVEVERTPATDTTAAVTEVVVVTVGLSANGLAEVVPVDDAKLVDGDRVVIGVDTHLLPGNADGESPAGGSDGDDDGGGDGDDGDGGSSGDDGGSSGDEGDDGTSPLAALFGWVQDPVEQRRQQLAIQEVIVDCMKAEGWEYEAVDWTAQMPDRPDEDWGSPEFGKKYGYGVMYQYELSGDGDQFVGVPFDDPNEEYVMSLSQADQEAYYADLYGGNDIWPTEPEIDEDGNEFWPSPPLDEQGCNGKAQLEVVGEDLSQDPEVQKLLQDYWSGQQGDAGLQEIVRKWAECFDPKLDEYGIDFTLTQIWDGNNAMQLEMYRAMGLTIEQVSSQAEMEEYWNSGQNVIWSSQDENGAGYVVLGPDGGGGGMMGRGVVATVPMIVDDGGSGLPELSGDEIDRLTAMELDLWAADQACQDDVGYAEYNQRREQELVDQILSQFPELG